MSGCRAAAAVGVGGDARVVAAAAGQREVEMRRHLLRG